MKGQKNKIEIIRKCLDDQLDGCYDFIKEKILNNTDYQTVANIPINDLPLHINDYTDDTPSAYVIKSLMAKQDPISIERINNCIPFLWNEEFDCDDYKAIGVNDGMLHSVASIYEALGDKEKEKLARGLIYSD